MLRNGRIESTGAGPAPFGVTVLDLKGDYVLPGLIVTVQDPLLVISNGRVGLNRLDFSR